MTPAKLMVLSKLRSDHLEKLSLPVDKLAWLHSNMNRDPGNNNSEYGPIRSPAPFQDLELFRTYYSRRRHLAAKYKDDGRDHNLLGAVADVAGWTAFAEGKRS